MKIKNLLVSAFALTMVASCAPSEKPTPDTTPTGNDVNEVINGFASKVEGSAKITFNSKYKVDVISEKPGMDGFKHDIDDKVVADLDLTANNLYLYVKNESKDGAVSKTREALVYKDGETYKYVTSVMENPLTLGTEDEAYAKIDELLGKISGNLAGYVDTKSLVFAKDGAYEHREFGLSTSNIEQADFISSPTIVKDGDGIKVNGNLDYIGYHTDAGISDFPGEKIDATSKKPAASYEIKTNEKGYVTSYNETMAAALEMGIMTPPPLVTINGTKSFAATYGAELTKINTIEHAKTTTALTITSTTQGTIETFVTPTIGGELVKVEDKGELVVGQFLAVKVTPAGSNTIKMVTFAGSSLETPSADGYFYFEIPEGKAGLTVNFVGADQIEGVEYGTTAWTATEDVIAIKLTPFTMAGGAPTYDDPVKVGANVPLKKFVRVEPTMAEGKELGEIKVDDKVLTLQFGQYFFEVKEAKTYTIVVTAKEAGEVVTAPATLTQPETITGGKAEVFTCAPGDFQHMAPVTNESELVAGNWICVKLTPDAGNKVTLCQLNGKDCMMGDPSKTGGFYCFTLVENENTLAITFGAAE